MLKKFLFLVCIVALFLSYHLSQSNCQLLAAEPRQTDIFVSGEGDYHTYRIPSFLIAKDGSLLAFCEGRKNGRGDVGNIDLVMKRSEDNGKTWSDLKVIWDDAENTCGNPCPVVDQKTGKIHLLLTWNDGKVHESKIAAGFGKDSRRVFVMTSTDHGNSWSEAKEITQSTKQEEWTWYATGPGAGIQIKNGPHAGRLVIPCDHKINTDSGRKFYSHAIYSDDAGETWKLGGVTPADQVNECEIVELENGRLMLNMRSYDRSKMARQTAISDDGAITWKDQKTDPALIESICQASIRRYRWATSAAPGVILFSNPATKKGRVKLTIRASYDDGKTWAHSRLLHEPGSAYSCLGVFPDGTIGCLYEKDGYKKITLATFPLSWVEGK